MAESLPPIPPIDRGRYQHISYDPSKYQTVDECIALSERLLDSAKGQIPIDTVVKTFEELWAPLPSAVIRDVGKCSQKFTVENTSLKDWILILKVFLMAGREADARAIVARRLAAIAGTDRERAAVLDSVFTVYIRATPPRLLAADTILAQLTALPRTVDPMPRHLKRLQIAQQTAWEYRDTVLARRFAEQVRTLARSVTESDRIDQNVPGVIFDALEHLTRDESLDSLRQGHLVGYYALKRRNWNIASAELEATFPFPWGRPAPKIVGQWYAPKDIPVPVPGTRPTAGKVALVVFVNANGYAEGRMLNTFATLRRLQQRFPALEINVVADHPPGYLGRTVVMDSVAEGKLWRQWLDYNRIPMAVAVEKPSFWRIPTPEDRRLIILRATNPTAYRGDLGVQNKMGTGEGFLIDQAGTIIDWIAAGVGSKTEPELIQIIEILLAMPTPPSTSEIRTAKGSL